MRAFAENHIEQNHSHFGVRRFLFHAADAQVVVDHRVQATNHEKLVAQVDDGMRFALEWILQGLVFGDRTV